MWYAVYDDTTGRLESSGSRVDQANATRRGLTVREYVDPPGRDDEWDEATKDYVTKTPDPRPTQRQQFEAHVAMQALDPTQRVAILSAWDDVIGTVRG